MITDGDVERWLREDVGHHDVTNQVPGDTEGRLVAKEGGAVAGLDAARAVFEYLGCEVRIPVDEGDRIEVGDAVLRVDGPAREVLRGERVAVNLVGHASGIATKTRRAVEAAREAEAAEDSSGASGDAASSAAADGVRIAATRKTTPGLRGVEKRAVAAAGGDTHRLDLSHMVMVKDNHVAEMGLDGAISHFRQRASFATRLDVEVESPDDAPRAAEAGADVVLLDNMTPAETERAVELVAATESEALTEASGGIAVADVPDYAATGVDVISMGSLTHSAPALDLSFRIG
ncbi:carboxylating nicotinate-nucleotide diphosphorylase [Halomicroarcula limicola]|uniref:Nicotinate-nucleotide pyrophosphorylase [carboxylating] n=1 Tax=Haloarcula limicola TaxID=1429915 RepID=A0A8J8C5D7_9EURY|nr:carboxylating nicotinate-nucleotide diphosphorylase [Halomicroarcula limicola]MBV0925109.1 carboxylating nicotinate-nucleotide diphosphorylase [Halomicroarcula limicola]